MHVKISKAPQPAFGSEGHPSEFFSFVTQDGHIQIGVRLRTPGTDPLPFRTGDNVDITGRQDPAGFFHLESFTRIPA